MTATTQPVLEIRHACCTFQMATGLLAAPKLLLAVDDVSLTLARGEVLAIVGESGSGKTTLGQMMLGLRPPDAGEILLEGQPIGASTRKALARKIQPVFQDPYASLNPRRTIGAIIGDPLAIHALGDRRARQRRVREMMEMVGLETRLEHAYPRQLSGGQRQRVAIARALITCPGIVICDEPTSALDVSVQAQILNLLADLRDRLGLSYVFISHDLSVVEFMADRIAVMYLGRIVECGPTRAVLDRPRHPSTHLLLGSVLTPEPGRGLPDAGHGSGAADPTSLPAGCHFHPRCPQALPVCSRIAPPLIEDGDGLVECHLHSPSR